MFQYLENIKRIGLQKFFIRPFTKSNQDRIITKNNSLLIVSQPRGGSNWLGEILMQIPNTALIDEPFWRGFYRSIGELPKKSEGKIKQLSGLGFYYDQHIPLDAEWPEAKKVIQSILRGEISNYDIWDKNKFQEIKKANKFLIKLCYGHLLVPWLHQNFNLKSIVMHRHPCAVVSSQMQFMAFSKIRKDPSGQIPDFRYNEIYKRYQRIFNSIHTKEEYLAAIWALKTKYISQNLPDDAEHMTVYYEHLLMNYRNTIEKIGNFAHADSKLLNLDLHKKASSSIPSRGHLLDGEQQLNKWRKYLSKSKINKILNIVSQFDIEFYNSDLMPKVDS